MEKSVDALRTISEVADYLEMPAHVLRFWESRFPQIKPIKRAGGRRYYRPADVALLSGIKRLLHGEGMTIRGVQKILREQGVRHVSGRSEADDAGDAAFETDFAADFAAEAEPVIDAEPDQDPPQSRVISLAGWAGTAAEAATTRPPSDAAPADAAPADAAPAPLADLPAPAMMATPQGPADLPWPNLTPAPAAEPAGPEIRAASGDGSDAPPHQAAASGGAAMTSDVPAAVGAFVAPTAVVPIPPKAALVDDSQTGALPAAPSLARIATPASETPAGVAEPAGAGSTTDADEIWLPSLVRRASPQTLARRRDRLLPLQARLRTLRDRMAAAAGSRGQ